ncbi:rCG63035 [Rattus norvegicus]|uniref:RCG63035 n=1 Tax=Rattus norvegicus TaxID=10116 RepID=A6HWF7_RAT|nr:rCG63035 [Rattus norvegicus]
MNSIFFCYFLIWDFIPVFPPEAVPSLFFLAILVLPKSITYTFKANDWLFFHFKHFNGSPLPSGKTCYMYLDKYISNGFIFMLFSSSC